MPRVSGSQDRCGSGISRRETLAAINDARQPPKSARAAERHVKPDHVARQRVQPEAGQVHVVRPVGFAGSPPVTMHS
jgi:hypothetical protein